MILQYWKLIAGAVGAAIIGIFIASWLSRGQKIERLQEWQDSVVLAVTAATVEPDRHGGRKALSPSQVVTAVATLRRSADNCESTLAGIDQAALHDKQLQATLDKQLSTILSSQDQAAEGTKARITDLLTRKSTGDREKDCEAMAADSAAAWDGWRK